MKTLKTQEAYIDLCNQWQIAPGTDDDHNFAPEVTDIDRYVLVETSRYGQTWVTTHASPDAAAQAHASQEYAEDWTCELIVDLLTGNEYELVVAARAVQRS